MNKSMVSILLLAAVASAGAATRTVTLSVPGMTCPACPITVKKALSRLDGVDKTSVNFDKREATAIFDDAKTTLKTLFEATTDAGYPSRVKR